MSEHTNGINGKYVNPNNPERHIGMRIPLKKGTCIKSNFNYIIDSVAGEGASSLVYYAHYQEEGIHKVIIKECYPYDCNILRKHEGELFWDSKTEKSERISSFKETYRKLVSFQNNKKSKNSTVASFHCFEANGTAYTVTLLDNGKTFDKDKTNNLTEILKTILALTKAVEKIHKAGYLHLDIKPENFLVIPETRELIRLFDFDTVTSIDDVKNGNVKFLSYSQGWSAPEQTQGNFAKLSYATDIYSIGAVLFYKFFGRKPENADRSQFAKWNFDQEIFDNVNPKVKRLLSELFLKTLSANPDRRYSNSSELVSALEQVVKVSEFKNFIISSCPYGTSNFIGRNNELTNIKELFENGAKTVFVHGFGGIGKTELAKKFYETYREDYDTVVFYFYNSNEGLKNFYSSVKYNTSNDEIESVSDFDKLQNLCKNSKVLFIIDNFDVEDDPELEHTLEINADFLFTTRNDYSEYFSGDNVKILELGTLSTDELLTLFELEYNKDVSDEDKVLISDIIESFDNYTLLIPIIAKYLISSGTTIKKYSEQIKEDGLKSFDIGSTEIRLRKDGTNVKKNQMSLLRYVFDMSSLSEEKISALKSLFILKHNYHLTKEEYQYFTKTNNLNSLNDLIFLNWVKYDEENISLHPAIQELVESDLTITPESVPGIYSYITDVVSNLKNCNSIKEASELGYALLLYYDICDNDKISDSIFIDVTNFINNHFFANKCAMFDLLFDSSELSEWCISPEWLMHKISNSLRIKIDSLSNDLETNLENTIMGLTLRFASTYIYSVENIYFE